MDLQRHTGMLVQKTLVTPDIAHLRIQLDKGQTLVWSAGQFIRLESHALPPPAPPIIRNYSLATAPADPTHIELLVRKVPNGLCSTWVHQDFHPGDPITFSGPLGLFHLSGSNAPMIGIAGSSGMSPLRAIFQEMLRKHLSRPAIFFFGARTRSDLFLLEEWAEFERKAPWFRFVPVLSNEPADSAWTGERGLVTEAVARHVPDLSRHEAYLCGSPGMLEAAKAELLKHGMPTTHVFFDKFNV